MAHLQAISNDNQQIHLEPKINKNIWQFLQDEDMLFNLVDALSSPLNLIFPQNLDDNIQSFQEIYKKYAVKGGIFFTSKPNKSQAVMRQAALHDVNVDVSSEESLKIKLGCGFHPSRIECTGPKNQNYLILALQQDIIINADNFEELDQIVKLRSLLKITKKTRIFVRLSGFHSSRLKFTGQDNTFGIHIDEAEQIFKFLLENASSLDFLGFAYYWSSSNNNDDQRRLALDNTLELTVKAMQRGLSPKGINIGGGFHVQYAKNRYEWLKYVEEIKRSLREQKTSLTWNDNGLGYRYEGGVVKGNGNYVDHCSKFNGAEDFEQVINLSLPSFGNAKFVDVLKDFLLELYIEPGRALLDQLGVTIGRVNFTKTSTQGETLVGLDMNRSNMHSNHQKLLTDPIIIYRDKSKRRHCPEGVYYMGNLCLSYDMITYNKTFPDLLPEAGDLVVFVNTAPYIMDFVESNTLHQKIAKKVAIAKTKDGFRWFEDETYQPALLKLEEEQSP